VYITIALAPFNVAQEKGLRRNRRVRLRQPGPRLIPTAAEHHTAFNWKKQRCGFYTCSVSLERSSKLALRWF